MSEILYENGVLSEPTSDRPRRILPGYFTAIRLAFKGLVAPYSMVEIINASRIGLRKPWSLWIPGKMAKIGTAIRPRASPPCVSRWVRGPGDEPWSCPSPGPFRHSSTVISALTGFWELKSMACLAPDESSTRPRPEQSDSIHPITWEPASRLRVVLPRTADAPRKSRSSCHFSVAIVRPR
jgi:hypothetical protein